MKNSAEALSKRLFKCIFPDVIAEYFEVVDLEETESTLTIHLDEKAYLERSDRKLKTVRPYGFTEAKEIQDFPLRGKAVYLHVRRRRWLDTSTNETFSYCYDDLTAEGSKLSPEFVAFLKEED